MREFGRRQSDGVGGQDAQDVPAVEETFSPSYKYRLRFLGLFLFFMAAAIAIISQKDDISKSTLSRWSRCLRGRNFCSLSPHRWSLRLRLATVGWANIPSRRAGRRLPIRANF